MQLFRFFVGAVWRFGTGSGTRKIELGVGKYAPSTVLQGMFWGTPLFRRRITDSFEQKLAGGIILGTRFPDFRFESLIRLPESGVPPHA